LKRKSGVLYDRIAWAKPGEGGQRLDSPSPRRIRPRDTAQCHRCYCGTTPSPEDKEVTHLLKEAGRLLGISVLEHIIITEYGYSTL
jgi:hypothetical protein